MKSSLYFVLSLLLWINKCDKIRISGGKEAKKGQFPFFAQVLTKRPASGIGQCAGTLIQPQLILTAAHCFPKDEEKRKHIVAMNLIKTYMGTIKDSVPDTPNEDAIENNVSHIFTHPYYDIIFPGDHDETSGALELAIQNDVAIVKVQREYKLSRFVELLPIPKKKPSRCGEGIIVGMGMVNLNRWPGCLMYARVKFIQHSQLSDPNMYDPMNDTVFYVESKFRHGHVMGGDSGGAALCDLKNGMVQHGIISTQRKNATTKIVVDVYEDIFQHLDFIMSVVEKERRMKPKSRASSITSGIFHRCAMYLKMLYLLA